MRPRSPPARVNDIVVTNTDGTTGTLVKGWVADFLDVPGGQQFHQFVTTLVSNAITAGVGGGLYGVDDDTLRQQMAVFLLKAKHGLCYTPPPCTAQVFTDVPCSSGFAPGSTSSSPRESRAAAAPAPTARPDPVLRQQMAVLLLKTVDGPAYAPPACVTGDLHGRRRARDTSRRGSTSSSRETSPAAAAAATTVPPRPPTAGRWPCSS